MDLVLYQPEIPENTATLLRLGACLGLELHLIEPLGFAFNTKKMRRIAMDYGDQVSVARYSCLADFVTAHPAARLVLATTKASRPHWTHRWQSGDFLVMGQESAGVPAHVRDLCPVHVTIPMAARVRSLNMAAAATLICGEWQRQISTG